MYIVWTAQYLIVGGFAKDAISFRVEHGILYVCALAPQSRTKRHLIIPTPPRLQIVLSIGTICIYIEALIYPCKTSGIFSPFLSCKISSFSPAVDGIRSTWWRDQTFFVRYFCRVLIITMSLRIGFVVWKASIENIVINSKNRLVLKTALGFLPFLCSRKLFFKYHLILPF